MIADLKPYPAMKNSGVPWLGEVPEHWEVVALRRVASGFSNGTSAEQISHGMTICPVSRIETISRGVIDYSRVGFIQPDKCDGRYWLRKGDVLLSHINSFEMVGNCAMYDGAGPLLHGMNLLRVIPLVGTNQRFLLAFLTSTGFKNQIRSICKPSINQVSVTTTGIKAIRLPVPPLPEQSAIVRFLDHADRRIRRYIRAKQKLIKLLEEQKQAIIHRAVTRGLDPNVRLKPSGVEWLGDVPSHWEVVPARYLFRSVTRREIRGDEVKLSVTQRGGLIPTDEMQENSMQASNFERFQISEPGDLVLNKYKAHLGVFWAASCRGLITPNYTVFRPVKNLSTKFFEFLFHTRTYRDAFTMTVYGVTEGMSPLYTQDFYSIPVVAPPRSEQESIVSEITDRTATENSAIAKVEREISLLREYRTRLIADVVTGKLDVREAAARLPDEVEEPAQLDEADALSDADEDAADDLDEVLEEAEA